jgi:hypothetical protein
MQTEDYCGNKHAPFGLTKCEGATQLSQLLQRTPCVSRRQPEDRQMKPIFILSLLAPALGLGLGGCDYSLSRVNLVADGDTSFMVTCAASVCGQRADEICRAQGYSSYDILERIKGDDLGEVGGILIQCKK